MLDLYFLSFQLQTVTLIEITKPRCTCSACRNNQLCLRCKRDHINIDPVFSGCCPGMCWTVQYIPGQQPLDRKSTRLNSSHVKISYAVCCLKKQKYRSPLHRARLSPTPLP